MPAEDQDTVNGEGFASGDLAERLQGPQGAEFAVELRERLERLKAGLEAEMRAGVGMGQLDRYGRVVAALASAAAVVIRAGDAKTRAGVPGDAP